MNKLVARYSMLVNNKGFTLAEILVVLGVLAVMLILLTEIFFSSIRGGNKTQIIGSLNENGRAIIDMIDKNVKNADEILCPVFYRTNSTNSEESAVLVTVKDGVYTRYKIVLPTATENGKIVRDNPTLEGQSQTVPNRNNFIQQICNERDIVGDNPVAISDTNTTSGVSVANGSFTRIKSAGLKDSVTINIDLLPGVNSPEKIPGRIDVVNFTTTIGVR